jgi:hypothetical protein
MRTRISIEAYAARLLALLSLGPLAASAGCEGSADDGETGPGVDCVDPTPLVEGQDTGYQRCASGALHRLAANTCGNKLPRDGVTCPADVGGCTSDAECTDAPNGMCHQGGFDGGCSCSYGCTTDSECGDGQICVCGEFIGHCAEATCKTDSDCDGGLCTTWVTEPGCGGIAFACSTTADECGGDGDCPQGEQCTMEGGHRVCVDPQCAIGRPFLVAGNERLAGVIARADWSAGDIRPQLDHLSTTERAALAAHWTQTAQMEHASVAAFARFVLQLLSRGAPPDLIHAAQDAMRDETEHARLCFALAGAYGGSAIGPAPLSLEGALEDQDARAILVGTILEGCIGETVAAIEAAEAAAHAVDPAVAAVLSRIAADETRHAELAWRYVAWALATGDDDLREVARRTFAQARADAAKLERAAAEPSADITRSLSLGRTTEQVRAHLRHETMERVIAPCAARLLPTGLLLRDCARAAEHGECATPRR